jgi:hypothetical protein
MKSLAIRFAGCLLVATCPSFVCSATELGAGIQALLTVDKEGAGHDAAVPILRELSQQPAAALIPLLQGMDQANPLAANWLRGAFETIADRNLKAGSLPRKISKPSRSTARTPLSRGNWRLIGWFALIQPRRSG